MVAAILSILFPHIHTQLEKLRFNAPGLSGRQTVQIKWWNARRRSQPRWNSF